MLCFASVFSFFLELFLHWSPVAYWVPTKLGSSSFCVLSFWLFRGILDQINRLCTQRNLYLYYLYLGIPDGLVCKESAYQSRRHKGHGFDPWVRKIPWRRAWQTTPIFLPIVSHGQKSLVGHSPWFQKVRDYWSDLTCVCVCVCNQVWNKAVQAPCPFHNPSEYLQYSPCTFSTSFKACWICCPIENTSQERYLETFFFS